ncbi:MAG: acyl-CoA thioesterase [Alphaproteobacteria bacterium]|nr:acyl-CoA thioesterase [Alphaproteobacteria bacterium]
MTDDLLFDLPVVVRVPVAWGDLDAFQHVNNTRYFRWFEDARIALFEQVGWLAAMRAGGAGPILARTGCVFRKPVAFPDTVAVGAGVRDLESDRFTMVFRVVSEHKAVVVAEGDARILSFDYRAGTKAPLPDEVHAALEALASS